MFDVGKFDFNKFLQHTELNSRKPYYNDFSDYTTNAPSYYDDLARKSKLIELLAKKIWLYDQELAKRFEEWDKNLEDFPEDVKKLLEKWLEDGTLDHIINETIFSWKADLKDLYELSRSVVSFGVNSNGDQSVNLQKALDWSSDTGNSIYFPSDLQVTVSKSLKMNHDSKLIMYRGSLINSTIPDGVYLDNTALINIIGDNVKLLNPLLDGNQSGVRPIDILERSNIHIKDGIINDFNRNAVYIEKSENITVDGLSVNNCGGELDGFSGTLRGAGKNIVFKNCKINNSNGKGITLVNSIYSTIANCIVDKTIHPAGDGIYISKSDYCNAYGNTVINPLGNLLKVSRLSSFYKIYGNNLKSDIHTGAYGVIIQGGRQGVFTNNTLTANNDQAVLWIEDHPDINEGGSSFENIISKNTITCGNDLMFGIHERTRPHANNPGYTVYENNISDNTVIGGRYGILSRATKRSIIKGNTIINPRTSGLVIEENSNDFSITNNIIRTLNANTITLNNVSELNISNNILYTDGGGLGINIMMSEMLIINSNNFKGFLGYGIFLDNQSYNNVISSNSFKDLNAGISVSNKNTIFSNIFENVNQKIIDVDSNSEIFSHDGIDNYFNRTIKIGPGGVIINRPADDTNFRLTIGEDGEIYAIPQEE